MRTDIIPFYQQYEQLVSHMDQVFHQMKEQYSECVTCYLGCADCCYALFDLTLIEAMYIHDKFVALDEQQQKQILAKAESVDRQIHVIKRKAYKAAQSGRDQNEIMIDIAREKIGCPLLTDDNQCVLYEHRPITCRIYGLPTAIGEKSHTCGKTNFEEGVTYPTIKMDQIHDRLIKLAIEWTSKIGTRFSKLHEVLVPLSMALITDYDDVYLGLKEPEPEPDNKGIEKCDR
jgi:Fe-S-cluster containining protein